LKCKVHIYRVWQSLMNYFQPKPCYISSYITRSFFEGVVTRGGLSGPDSLHRHVSCKSCAWP
jgi:hypothetical protein